MPDLHVIVTDEVAADPGFERRAASMQERCGPRLALHLRLRDLPVRKAFALAETLEEGAMESGGWLVVNRRVDLALAAGADGVQLGRGALPVEVVRELAGDSLAIGASVHDVREADERRRAGADFLVAGPIYTTRSHPGAEPAGPGLIERLAPMPLPIVAIGGVDAKRLSELAAAGAAGAAVISAVWTAPDPVAAAVELCEHLPA